MILGLIPARGGSKGLPNKNKITVGGLPLLSWTIRTSLACQRIDRLILSTDDECLAEIARAEGCEVPFMRPSSLASDTASSASVVLHALSEIGSEYDGVVFLQPTSPLRSVVDIETALDLYIDNDFTKNVVSFVNTKFSPSTLYSMNSDSGISRVFPSSPGFTRRQDAKSFLLPSGAIYVLNPRSFLESNDFIDNDTLPLVIPSSRSLDIDTQVDLDYLNFLVQYNPELIPPPVAR